jgi:DNA-binding transcriptional regulator YbjK
MRDWSSHEDQERGSAEAAAESAEAQAAGARRARRRAPRRHHPALVLDAAERSFAESGFDGVSLRTITERAGVDLALANYHFGIRKIFAE